MKVNHASRQQVALVVCVLVGACWAPLYYLLPNDATIILSYANPNQTIDSNQPLLPLIMNETTINHRNESKELSKTDSHNTTLGLHTGKWSQSRIVQAKMTFPFYIFQIGFNKVGTRAILAFLEQNGITGRHHRYEKGSNTTLLDHMKKRYAASRPIFSPLDQTVQAYGDFSGGGVRWRASDDNFVYAWQVAFHEYRNSKFILNIRNVNHWLKSRFHHSASNLADARIGQFSRKYNVTLSDAGVLQRWKEDWYMHCCRVIEFFQVHNNMHNLFIFDIENDNITKMAAYFKPFGIKLKSQYWGHQGTTTAQEHTETSLAERWQLLVKEFPELTLGDNIDDTQTITERSRIYKVCNGEISLDEVSNLHTFPF